VKLRFLGAVQTVTGSSHLLTVNGRQILLDCGLFQGRRQESFERNRRFPFDPAQVDALVLSHAHIDHSGNIPNLVKRGFQGPIHATSATRDLCAAMLRDCAHVMESDAAFVNKKLIREGERPAEPIYTVADAIACVRHFLGLEYERPLSIAPGVRLTFFDAGHILGAAITVLDLEEDGRTVRLAFTGDLGRRQLPILRDPVQIPPVDYLICESTYGDRLHASPDEAKARLRAVILDAYAHGGKVIIPAFAVGRTQEIVYDLHQLTLAQDIPQLPIFVDSPLATDVTEIFRLHPECYDEETHALLIRDRDPFGFRTLRYTRFVEDSKALNFLREPAVIISASGMCEAGRVLHHLKNQVGNPRNTVLMVGFQAQNTLGRKLLDGAKEVRILGEVHQVRAKVELIDGYSAHADRKELLDYIRPLGGPKLKEVFLVHGEVQAAQSLVEGLKEMGIRRVLAPEPRQEVSLE